MTVEDSTAVTKVPRPPHHYAKVLSTFACKKWIDPPTFVPPHHATPEELTDRDQKEIQYRKVANPTEWKMYLSLGRYVVDGYIFQAIMQDFSLDPLQVYCLIFYQYSYHVDRLLELPPKLDAWTSKRAIPFLEKNKEHALNVDTTTESWKQYAARLSLPLQWTEVVKNKKRTTTPPASPMKITEHEKKADDETTTAIPLPSPPHDESLEFTTDEWFEPFPYVTDLPETSPETNIRNLAETEYRKSSTPAEWLRYMTLGRYVVDGFTFNKIIGESTAEPLTMHCLIWFQYVYHLDYKIEIPEKLQAWAVTKSQAFLSKHLPSAIIVDTKKVNWTDFSSSHSLSTPWSDANRSQKKAKKVSPSKSYASVASTLGKRSNPSTIVEETSETSGSTEIRGQKRSSHQDEASAASDGKQSVLLPSSNVPVCDGTYRVTLRWKTTLDIKRISQQAQEMKGEIHALLDDLFEDDDGLLYKWQQTGTEERNCISAMTPTEVRRFISPSIGIFPSQSIVVIPIRYGFTSNNPSKWRNSESTKTKLEKHKVTASFSNCTSASGNLVIAGYILLKAPMTTHRLRYLQYLRQLLPPSTPAFDILLHKRTPSDQLISHLAVQCGNSHVHSLSEALAPILTGDGSALYMPRFVFSQMADGEARALFETHDAHVKSLRWLSLSPLLTNLDTIRKEYQPDGTVLERSTRSWARSIKTVDGKESAQCDVVNGGTDQLAYLLFTPPQFKAANDALDAYRKRLYPFKQREAQFRASIGPPTVVHLSRPVIANLEFMKRLSSDHASGASTNEQESPDNNSASGSGSTVSSVSQATCPPTSAESVQKQFGLRTPGTAFSVDEDDSTTASTNTSPSKPNSTGRLSTNSAKVRDLDKQISRQKVINDQKDAMNSERVSHIERQLKRLNDLDTKLDNVQTDFGQRLNIFESRMVETVKGHIDSSNSTMENMNNNLSKLMSVVNQLVASRPGGSGAILYNTAEEAEENSHTSHAQSGSQSSSSKSSNMSTESTGMLSSPDHKRMKPGKKPLKESIRRCLDDKLRAAQSTPPPPIEQVPSFDSLDQAIQDIDDINNADASAINGSGNENNDLESQYTASSSSSDADTNATPSPGRANAK